MKDKEICLKCDNGKGHKMHLVYSYLVSGDVDKAVCWICPNCSVIKDIKRIRKAKLTKG